MTTGIGLLALASTLACATALVRVHLLPTGYDPRSNAVSDYGVGPYRVWYRLQAAFMAFAALFVAAGVARETHPVPQRLLFLLMTFAAARLVIPSFPTDLDRGRRTGTGLVHILLAAVAFASIAWAAAILPDRVRWEHGLLVVLGWIVVVTAAACGLAFSRGLRSVELPFFGAVERLFYAAVLVWLAVVSVHFL